MTDKIIRSWATDGYVPNDYGNAWYTLLNATEPQNNDLSFKNTSLVMELSKRMWKGLAAYIVKHEFTIPSNETSNGTATSIQGRLCVQVLSLRLVEAHVTLLLALTIALSSLRPGMLHRDPTSLFAHAIIMARSPGVMDILQSCGTVSKQILRSRLSRYQATFPQHLPPGSSSIDLHDFRGQPDDVAEKATSESDDPHKWWSPMSVRWWFRICLMIEILAVLIVLEVLLQISDRKDGLGHVSLAGYLKYTWSFLPTLVLVSVGLLFSMVDSTARTLHSFQLLRKGQATMEDILYDPARQVSLSAVFHAAWKRHFVLLSATFPGLLAPLLTIVTTGLYTVYPVPWTYDASLELKDCFRPENRTVDKSNRVEGDSDEAFNIFTLTQLSNMSHPRWTQGEYALVSFGADNLHNHDGNDTFLSFTARVPATRANLNCSLIGRYTNNTYKIGREPRMVWFPVDPRPLGCHTPPEWNHTTAQRDLYLTSSELRNVDGSSDWSMGYYLTLLEDKYSGLVSQRENQSLEAMTSIRVCGDGRQHYFIGLGYGTGPLSVLHCVPYVEALWVDAAFSLPDLSLVTDVPVIPDRDSSVFLSDSASMTAFDVFLWDTIVDLVVNGSSGSGQVTGLPPGPDREYTDRLIATLKSSIAQYLAQNIHSNYRRPLGDKKDASIASPGQDLLTANGHPITGTVTDRMHLRLIQNAVSTRILQGLLAVMGACLVASTALGRGAKVIPRDPGSVASRMAYFAGGQVWQRVPEGADRWTDEQIKRHGLGVSGRRLLLDWWGGDDQEDSESRTHDRRFAVDSTDRKEVS